MDVETQPSTIDYYHEKRQELLNQINDGECERCDEDDPEKLQIHHVNPDKGHESGVGGWDHLYKAREDLEQGVELEVLCIHHHIVEHRKRNDLTPLTRYES